MKRLLYITLVATIFFGGVATAQSSEKPAKKRIYMSYILHGNMNYDRYVRPTIWRDFPIIYDNLLDFMDEHPDFKGQLQFSGQTLNSMRQAAPEVLEHAMKIHKRGQLNFTGTFYSEPVNVNMDGEIDSADKTASSDHRHTGHWKASRMCRYPTARCCRAAYHPRG